MSEKVFDYNGIFKIKINGPKNLLERIAENIEKEVSLEEQYECSISIIESKKTEKILKDKRYNYLTIERFGTEKQPSIRYTRYNTYVRTIHQKSLNEYLVENNTELDEASGLICFRNYLNNHSQISKLPLIHGSLINLNGKGILIAGNSRQGKTTSMIYLLSEQDAIFVGDENIILDKTKDNIKGIYIPKNPRVRFSTIIQSNLSRVLENIELANATQYIDSDSISRIISSKSFEVDAGIAFSRKAFCKLLNIKSKESSNIDVILLPKYTNDNSYSVKEIGIKEGVERLSHTGLKRKYILDSKELDESQIDLIQNDFKNIKFIEVAFSDINHLRNRGFKL